MRRSERYFDSIRSMRRLAILSKEKLPLLKKQRRC